MLATNETEMCFDRKADALRVQSALGEQGVSSRYVSEGRGSNWLRITVPDSSDAQRTWELARSLYFARATGKR